MIISDYAAARHLSARLEIGVDDDQCTARVGFSLESVLQAMLPPASYSLPAPTLSPWSEVSTFYTAGVEQKRELRMQARAEDWDLINWWLGQIHQTKYSLQERMTLFWHNHFTSDTDKVIWPQLMYRQNQLLREHALGNFADLLHAIARDPAMLIYLDGLQNVVSGPNENFARELLELFTLGVDHYTEADITNVARAFTGWSVDLPAGEFVFKPLQHDNGNKQFMGRNANLDGDDILNILLQEPRTAEYIAEKFWAEFINHDTPDPAVIATWGKAFRDSGYEITALLHTVIHSQVFWDQAQRGRLIKSPVEFTIGLLREFKLEIEDYDLLRKANQQLGQNLFHPPDVKGWRGGNRWITNSRLIRRYDLIPKLLAEHTDRMNAMLTERGITPKLAVKQDGRLKIHGLFKELTARFSCETDTASLSSWLLPLEAIGAPDCQQAIDIALLTLLKDPTYQLR